jgi:type II secretory pathway predicted ATPase ExeA
MSEQHARAVTNIKFALANRDCFVIITGEIGVGKTTILNSVLKSLDDDIEMARLTHTSLSPVELLQAVLLAFDQPVKCDSKVLLVDQIRRFLLSKYDENKHVVIAVDEAQNLGASALEELRLLTCIEADTKELLTVVLMGQPALSDLIDSHELHNLKQRTRLRQHLRRLTLDQTIEYLKHRLLVVGGDFDKIFAHDAVLRIYDASLGTPRLINTLCDTAMTATAIRDLGSVTEECILEVLDELGWERNHVKRFGAGETDTGDLPTLAVFHHGQLMNQITCSLPLIAIGRCVSNHLQIDDRSISRRHAIISFLNGHYCVEDLGSKNGTYHNGRECGGRRYALQSGDQITLGHYQLVFRGADSNADNSEQSGDDTCSVTHFARLGSGTGST